MKIKSVFCLILSIAFLFSTAVINVSAEDALKGDMNGDGVLSVNDAARIYQMVVNSEKYDDMADVNSDGRITAADFRVVQKLSVGDTNVSKYAENCFPAFFGSLDGSNAVTDEVKSMFSLNCKIVSDGKYTDDYEYYVSVEKCEKLSNVMLLITFDETNVDTSKVSISDCEGVLEYSWFGSQLLIGIVYNDFSASDSVLFTIHSVISECTEYEEPRLEVLEVNDMLNRSICIHSGGVATCVDKKVCDKCGVCYGNLIEHTGGAATCSEKAKCEVCGEYYGETTPHINADMSSECDVCGGTFGSAGAGINTSIIILNDIVYYTVYFDGVETFGNINFTLDYESCYHYSDYYCNADCIDSDVQHNTGEYHCIFTPSADYVIDEYNSVLFSAYFIIRDTAEFDYDKLPSMYKIAVYDAVMTDGSTECPVNSAVIVDCSHEHIDSEADFICDLCGELITDNTCYHKDDDYNCRCDYCGGPYYYYGDMDVDGRITAADARVALRIAAKLQPLTEYDLFVGDIDGDGRIIAADARKILRVAARLDQF